VRAHLDVFRNTQNGEVKRFFGLLAQVDSQKTDLALVGLLAFTRFERALDGNGRAQEKLNAC